VLTHHQFVLGLVVQQEKNMNKLMSFIAALMTLFFGWAALTMADLHATGMALAFGLVAAVMFATAVFLAVQADLLKATR
jgi:hypothetical protein